MKLVFAPFGSDLYGSDILLFEHTLLFALETAAEAIADIEFADVHGPLAGDDKRERPLPPLREDEIYALAGKAECDAFIDGMLLGVRHNETGELISITAAPRLLLRNNNEEAFEIPDALIFDAFTKESRSPNLKGRQLLPEDPYLSLDYNSLIAFQYRLCEVVYGALGAGLPDDFTMDSLRISRDWHAYQLFIKGKRMTLIAETKLGYYEQASKADPEFYLALYNAAMLYKTQTDYNMARMRLMKAVHATHDPKLLNDTYFELGLCSIYLGDTKTARNFWENALEYGGDNPTLLVNMAGTYEQEEKWDEAIRLNQLTVDRFPDYHKAIVNLARLYAMTGKLDKAIPLYERALELNPDDALRHSVLGGCYLAAGEPDKARSHFESAVELDPNSDPGKYAAQELEKLDTSKKRGWFR